MWPNDTTAPESPTAAPHKAREMTMENQIKKMENEMETGII